METTMETSTSAENLISKQEMLEHWQGQRRLGRKVLAAFPEKELFEYSIGGMRPYSELAGEMIGLASAGMQGFVTGKWETKPELDHFNEEVKMTTKQQMLDAWDEVTEEINTLWPQIQDFSQMVKAFGQYENSVLNTIWYFLDNDIHHRGQGYVYLRSLGINPPPFWETW